MFGYLTIDLRLTNGCTVFCVKTKIWLRNYITLWFMLLEDLSTEILEHCNFHVVLSPKESEATVYNSL